MSGSDTVNPVDETQLIRRAREGGREALETLIGGVRDKVYGLALRMLYSQQDAEDATQEILIRAMTHLSQFRGESAFSSWVYRIAANYLVGVRKRNAVEREVNFERFAEGHDAGLAHLDDGLAGPDADLLEEDLKIGCSSAMLMCLDRPHRLVFILGKILELPSKTAAEILDLNPQAYRKRLSRAHGRIRTFMEGRCGLVNPANPCRCRRRVNFAVQMGRVNPHQPEFASRPGQRDPLYLRREIEKMDQLQRAVAVFRSHPRYRAPERFVLLVKELIHSHRLPLSQPARPDVPNKKLGNAT